MLRTYVFLESTANLCRPVADGRIGALSRLPESCARVVERKDEIQQEEFWAVTRIRCYQYYRTCNPFSGCLAVDERCMLCKRAAIMYSSHTPVVDQYVATILFTTRAFCNGACHYNHLSHTRPRGFGTSTYSMTKALLSQGPKKGK